MTAATAKTCRWLGPLVLVLTLPSCGLFSGDPAPKRETRGARAARHAAAATPQMEGPHTVLFVVIDTLRADHTSLCGYARPTTPFLDTMVAEHGWKHTCGLVTPGTWTLPSHASFFTGLSPAEHQLLSKGYPLREDVPTLAEQLGARGYTTILASANPTLNKVSGIGRGFDRFESSPGLYATAWRGKEFGDRLDEALRGVSNDQPLFLFVNLFDAHDPYPAVPEGVDWLPKQPSMDVNPSSPKSKDLVDLVRGTLTPERRAKLVARLTDTYDYGISEADRNVRRLVATLKAQGRLDRPLRVVVTSDHGENLGEHDLIRHDGPPWETVTQVPLLVFDSAHPELQLPAQLSGLTVHGLVLDGALPAELPVPAAYAVAHHAPTRMRQDSVALWGPSGTKSMWVHAAPWAIDLVADPGETSLAPLQDAATAAHLRQEVDALTAAKTAAGVRGSNPAMLEALKMVGYLDDDLTGTEPP